MTPTVPGELTPRDEPTARRNRVRTRTRAAILGLVLMLLIVAGAAVGDRLRRVHDGDAAAVAAPMDKTPVTPAPMPVCRGDVEGVLTAVGTVGVDTSPDDGGDSVGTADTSNASVLVLGQFPARTTPEPYLGQRAWAHLKSGTGETPGRVTGVQFDDAGTSLYVAVALDEAPVGATDGESATVSIEIGVSQDTLYVPTSLLHRDTHRSWVKVRRAGSTIDAMVRTGLSGQGRSEIVAGLRPDDELIIPPGAVATCDTARGPRSPEMGADTISA